MATKLNFEEFSSLGAGAESFALLEGDLAAGPAESPAAAEAEVKVSVRSAEDAQQDALADTAADDVEAVSDAGAELFKDIQRLAHFSKVLGKHPLHPSLYAFVNGNKQLDKILNIELPAVEKLDAKSDNKSVKDIILPKLETYFKDDVSTKIANFYKIFSKRLEKLESAMNTVVKTRRERVAEMIARLEQDDAPEAAAVTTEEAPAEATEPANDNAGDAPVSVPDETSAPEEGSEETPVEGEAEAPASVEPEPVNVDANTSEECSKLMATLGIDELDDKPIVNDMNEAVENDPQALKNVMEFVGTSMAALIKFRQMATKKRKIIFKKSAVLDALKALDSNLKNWDNINKLHYACKMIAKMSDQNRITGVASFNKTLPVFQTAIMTQNYLQTAKRVNDAVYANLKFATYKLLNSKNK